MTEYLKPCPFCNGNAHIVVDEHSKYLVRCSHCFIQTPAYFNHFNAVDLWNNRVDKASSIDTDAWDDALRALIRAVSDISDLVKGGEG